MTTQEKIEIAKRLPNVIRYKFISPSLNGVLFVWENTDEVPTNLHGKPIQDNDWPSLKIRSLLELPEIKEKLKQLV